MICFKNVGKKFGATVALEEINLKIKPGEFIFLIGPSGSGKTTFFRLLLREYLPSDGQIEVGDLNLAELPKNKLAEYRRKFGVVFQDLKLLEDRTVIENISLPLIIANQDQETIDKAIKKVLHQVDLDKRADFFPRQLSQGELQRSGLARALITQPEIILADEPTGNLDLNLGRQIVKLLEEVNHQGKTVIMATHNFEIVNSQKHRVIELDKGKLVSDQEKGQYQFK